MKECPTPGKRKHATHEEGKEHIRALYRAGRGNPDYTVYACVCGWFHVGHSRRKLEKRIRRALRRGK